MKLLTKTSLFYLAFSIPVIVICSFICFYLIHDAVIESTDDALMKDFLKLKESFLKKDSAVNFTSLNGEIIARPSQLEFRKTSFSYSDTTLYDNYEEEYLPFRVLKVNFVGTKNNFNVIVRKGYLESDELLDGIFSGVGLMFGLLLAGFFAINFFVSRNLWTPFYKTLDSLSKFDLGKKETLNLPRINTSEFGILNKEINKMTDKILSDYQNLKEFTENASHEIQTPLAIIRSKLELMIQSENFSQEQMKFVQDIYESINRLSKLNQSLLLLAKIENRQFHEIQTIDLKKMIENKLSQFEDMIAFKNISIEKQLGEAEIQMNPHLADILFSNIIGNAIRHNINEGKIIIQLKDNLLSVSNSGNLLTISPEKLFKRFQKASPSSDSAGLGLSIVKQICDTYNFKVNYTHTIGMHTISLKF